MATTSNIEIIEQFENNNLNNNLNNNNNNNNLNNHNNNSSSGSGSDNDEKKKPNRNEYFKHYMRQYYYDKRSEMVKCMFCNKDVMKCRLTRHHRGDKCQKLQRQYLNV